MQQHLLCTQMSEIHNSLAVLITDIRTLHLKDRKEYKVTKSVFLPEIAK